MRLMDPIPLRTTQAVSGYRQGGALARIYGDLEGAPITPRRIGETRYLFADHPATVSQVWIDGQATFGWEAAVEELAGQAASVITLAAPPAVGAQVTASGRGLPATHPADIIDDLLRWCGATHLSPALDLLRIDAPGLELGVVLDDPALRLRDVLDALAKNAALAWSAERIWWPPVSAGGPAPAALAEASLTRAVMRVDRAADQIDLDYDLHADGKLARRLSLRGTPARVRRPRSLAAPWLRNARAAELVASRLLAQMAMPPWEVTLETSGQIDCGLGETVLFEHPASPLAGAGLLTITERVLTGERLRLSGELRPLGEAVRAYGLTLTAAGVETQYAAVEVASAGGSVTFTVLDPDGRPLGGARVSLDGGPARLSDARGRVSFSPVAPGRHSLAIEASGYQPFSIEVFV